MLYHHSLNRIAADNELSLEEPLHKTHSNIQTITLANTSNVKTINHVVLSSPGSMTFFLMTGINTDSLVDIYLYFFTSSFTIFLIMP